VKRGLGGAGGAGGAVASPAPIATSDEEDESNGEKEMLIEIINHLKQDYDHSRHNVMNALKAIYEKLEKLTLSVELSTKKKSYEITDQKILNEAKSVFYKIGFKNSNEYKQAILDAYSTGLVQENEKVPWTLLKVKSNALWNKLTDEQKSTYMVQAQQNLIEKKRKKESNGT
jgi:hypothetical protein